MTRVILLFFMLTFHLATFAQRNLHTIAQSEDQRWFTIESIENRQFSSEEYHIPKDCHASLIQEQINFERDFASYFTEEELELFLEIKLIGKLSFNDEGRVEQMSFLTKVEPTPFLDYFPRIEKLLLDHVDLSATPCKNLKDRIFNLHLPLYIRDRDE